MKVKSLVIIRNFLRNLRFQKPFYITSPIFYANGLPHLGHLYSLFLCDVRKRWEKINGNTQTYFLTGTDEHGIKVETTARKHGKNVLEFVENSARNFQQLSKNFMIEYDEFVRTTDTNHCEVVRYFWRELMSRNLIYKKKHSNWYSVIDETFYTLCEIKEIYNQSLSKTVKVAKETGNEVLFHEEENYFFKLSEFQGKLIQHLETNPKFITPHSEYKKVIDYLKNNELKDLSISRHSSRLKWAINVPDDDTQMVYVWFDALFSYLSSFFSPEKGFSDNYVSALHVVGKDISKFHSIYWPLFLLALDIKLPQQIHVHSHWLHGKKKMSKSLGNIINPNKLVEKFSVDAIRFYLGLHSNLANDSNFDEHMLLVSNEYLIMKFANLLLRCDNPKFDIKESVNYARAHRYDDIDLLIKKHNLAAASSTQIILQKNQLISSMNSLHEKMNNAYLDFNLINAIKHWCSFIESANSFFQTSEAWRYNVFISNNKTHSHDLQFYNVIRNFYLFLVLDSIRIASILLFPIIPTLSTKILNRLNVSSQSFCCSYAFYAADLLYGPDSSLSESFKPIPKFSNSMK